MRAKAAIEQVGKDRENIVITEIPYQVNKARLVERIAELVQTKKIEGISDVRDESDREGMRVVVEVKRGEESQLILNHLYKLTQMQESFGMILLAITGGQPREMGLVELLRLFLEHRRDVVLRRTRFDLRKAEEREHILLGYHSARRIIDRNHQARAAAARSPKRSQGTDLIERWERSPTTPGRSAILELQLHRLTRLSRDEILKELAASPGANRRAEGNSGQREKAEAGDRRRAARDPEGFRRRAAHADRGRGRGDQGRGPDRRRRHGHHHQPCRLHQAHARWTSIATSRAAARAASARARAKKISSSISSSPRRTATFCCSARKGRVYWLKVYEIPEAAAATRGKAIGSLVKFQEDEHLTALVPARNLEEAGRYVFFATRNGTVKKTALAEFSNPRPSGIIAINLEATTN